MSKMGDQFCLKWNNHQNTLISVFDTLLGTESLVDCTLVAGGQFLKGHKVVLSACSPLLETLLGQHSEKHPILILKDIKFHELRAMMDYMYRGEVNISQDQLDSFLRAAESLQIKGLTDQGGGGGGESKGGGPVKSESNAVHSPPAKRRRRATPEPTPDDSSQASEGASDKGLPPAALPAPFSLSSHMAAAAAAAPPQDRLKSEPPDPAPLKQEYEGQHSDVEDLTLDDEDDYSTVDAMIQPGTSHAAAPNTPQSFSNWQAQAIDRTNDEVFLAAQNAINNQNNAQGYCQSLDPERPFLCNCGRTYKSRASIYNHQRYECGKEPNEACPYCPYKAKLKSSLRKHVAFKHKQAPDIGRKTFACHPCGIVFDSENNLLVHQLRCASNRKHSIGAAQARKALTAETP